MLAISGIDHIVLRTKNREKLVMFYCDILGCTVENIQDSIALTQLRAGRNLIDIVEVDQMVQRDNSNLEHFCLRLENFDYSSLQHYFLKHNIKLHRYGKRYGSQGMGYSFYICDCDGNEIELC